MTGHRFRRDLLELLELTPPPNEGQLVVGSRSSFPRLRSEAHGPHRFRLSFHEEGFELSRLEAGPRTGQEVRGRQDLARLCLGHETGGEVDGVPHHRERPPVVGPDLADKDRSLVHTDPDRERILGIHDLAEGEQHAVFVVP